ncbi:hypothetical protein Bca101_017606 [Brassica carinata]
MSIRKPTTSASVSMIFINKAVIMQCPHSTNFQTLEQVANSSLIHCGRQNGTRRANVIVWPLREASLRFFYNANVVFVLARLR